METILIIGAGKSATVLIDYLLARAAKKNGKVLIADHNLEHLSEKIKKNHLCEGIKLELDQEEIRKELISKADVVVSMLPADLHPVVAKDCLELGKNFFSASYESPEMRALGEAIKAKGLFFLNECGLDPGLDHMSAMKIIDREKAQGNEITLFKSYCGGLVAPESEGNNPWKYKFSWNPRNVILAGQGVSRFLRNGKFKFIPYHMLFRRTDLIKFKEVGNFDGYANRDSLGYRQVYGLDNIPTIIRGTLRREGFCKSWDVLVQLGLTDNSFQMDLPEYFTHRMLINAFLPFHPTLSVEEKIRNLLPWVDQEILDKISWLGLLGEEMLPRFTGTPAEILQGILEKKWAMEPKDKDMVVMQHQFEVDCPDGQKEITSSLVIKGEDREHTAMAKTVGIPLYLAVDLFLEGKINLKGLHLPTVKEIYEPILEGLEQHGIVFDEEVNMKQKI